MFKFIQDNKIKEVREEDTFNRAFYAGEFEEDTEHSVEDYVMVDDQYLLKEDVPIDYKKKQIRLQRQYRYTQESDPIKMDYDEALARGDTEEAERLRQEWLDAKDQIREELPYEQ